MFNLCVGKSADCRTLRFICNLQVMVIGERRSCSIYDLPQITVVKRAHSPVHHKGAGLGSGRGFCAGRSSSSVKTFLFSAGIVHVGNFFVHGFKSR